MNMQFETTDLQELFPAFPAPRVGPLGWDGDACAGIADAGDDTTGYMAAPAPITIDIIIRPPVRR